MWLSLWQKRMIVSAELLLLGVLLSMILTACETIPTIATGVECTAFSPITYSATNDSLETIKQIREHNAAWRAICESKK